MISIKLQSNFTEITLRHGFSTVNLLYIFKTFFPGKNYLSMDSYMVKNSKYLITDVDEKPVFNAN